MLWETGSSRKFIRRYIKMLKKSKLILAVALATLTIGAATFALAESSAGNCCVTQQPCCR
jgi:hypothetical protein